jgi:hypothetical protein
MKYWEIIADNLTKADGVGAVYQLARPLFKSQSDNASVSGRV